MVSTTQRGTYGDVKIRGATPDTRHSCNNKSAFASETNIPADELKFLCSSAEYFGKSFRWSVLDVGRL